MFEAIASDLHCLPLAYFEERARALFLSSDIPCGYLQLSAGCKTEAGIAKNQGWRVRGLSLHHLAMLTHPEEVAMAFESLIEAMRTDDE